MVRNRARGEEGALTSLRLSFSADTVRMSPRRPVASAHSSSTKAPTSCVKVAVLSFSSSSSCRADRAESAADRLQPHGPTVAGLNQPAGGGQSPAPEPGRGRSVSAAARSEAGSLSGACRPPAPPLTWAETPACPSLLPSVSTDTPVTDGLPNTFTGLHLRDTLAPASSFRYLTTRYVHPPSSLRLCSSSTHQELLLLCGFGFFSSFIKNPEALLCSCTFSKMEYLATWKPSGNGGRSESSSL